MSSISFKGLTFLPETHPVRIVEWETVTSVDLLRIFYQQHLGPLFTAIPTLEIERPLFIEMINGDNAILADVFQFSPELLEDIALIFTRASQDSVKIAMNLESESCGGKIIEFLAGCHASDLHAEFRKQLEILAERVQVHHYTWQRDRQDLEPFGLYNVLIPKASMDRLESTRKRIAQPDDDDPDPFAEEEEEYL
jgi:hypothetical protein